MAILIPIDGMMLNEAERERYYLWEPFARLVDRCMWRGYHTNSAFIPHCMNHFFHYKQRFISVASIGGLSVVTGISTECVLVHPLSIYSIPPFTLSSLKAASYICLLVFPSLLSFPLSFLE
jgi:hypothetical protein